MKREATIEDLYHVPDHGKAEIVNGKLVRISPAGSRPGRATGKIIASLGSYEEQHGGGYVLGGSAAFIVNLPRRKSFCPDAAWFIGDVDSMKFAEGAPVFAVEVRNEGDYGPKAERAIAAKIADYFAAGTKVVWDVDLLGEDVVKVYRATDPNHPTIYRRGELAEAEPAVPGWKFPVDKLFA